MEQREVKINNQNYIYHLRRWPRARHVRLTMEADGKLVVTAPRIYPLYLIKNFIISRQNWISKNLQQIKLKPSLFSIKHSNLEIIKLKKQTRELVSNRLQYFNQFYNLKYNRISIRNQKSRWGSCSSAKNLNYNYRLILLPAELADYIIVHELCHVAVMRHSQDFWQLVAQTMPDYKIKEKQLKNI